MFDGFVNNNNWTNFVYVISYYLEKNSLSISGSDGIFISSFLLRGSQYGLQHNLK